MQASQDPDIQQEDIKKSASAHSANFIKFILFLLVLSIVLYYGIWIPVDTEQPASVFTTSNVAQVENASDTSDVESSFTMRHREVSSEAIALTKIVFKAEKQVVISSKIDGEVISVSKRFGQSFKKGEVILKLDETLFSFQRNAAIAKLNAAKENYTTIADMHNSGSASKMTLENAKQELAEARANLAMADYRVDACTLVAPFAGRVAITGIEEGELVQAGMKLMELVSDDVLWARFLLPESSFHEIKIGQVVKIELEGSKKIVSGIIKRKAATIDPASETFEIRALVKNADGMIRSGMNGALLPENWRQK